MATTPTQTLILAVVVVLALIAVGAWIFTLQQQRQSRRLQQRFGPEYSRAVAEIGNRTQAESVLREREKRVDRLEIVPLAPSEAARFNQAWSTLQSRFVDSPQDVVLEADQLVRELMLKRGYPVGDFERRAADISVDHPAVVDTYRSAQAIAVRSRNDEASTEELRKAVVYYRALFDELLEVTEEREPSIPKKTAAMDLTPRTH